MENTYLTPRDVLAMERAWSVRRESGEGQHWHLGIEGSYDAVAKLTAWDKAV